MTTLPKPKKFWRSIMNRHLPLSFFFCLSLSIAFSQGPGRGFSVEYLTRVPSQIDGCSGLYTYDTTALKRKKYIIATDLQELAFIKVNGKQIRLQRISSKELPQQTFQVIYKGGGYTVTLTTKSFKLVDELSQDRGIIQISNTKKKVTIKIHGESGC